MKARDLVVGRDYYYETSPAKFDRASSRDIDNVWGEHRVTVLETDLYRRQRISTYVRPGSGQRGTHVRVMIHGSTAPDRVSRARARSDREGFVTLGGIRGEWDAVVAESREAIAARVARDARRDQDRARYRDELTSLVNRARNYGLMVSAPSLLPSREGTANFYVNEENLTLFLDALDEATRELSTTSTGGTT